jgi:DNA adenine methylase
MKLASVPSWPSYQQEILDGIHPCGESRCGIHFEKPAWERQSASIVSPLRYPGSKRRLAGYIKQTLTLNGCSPALFVEPFAGGASVALQLLNDNKVERIGLIDLDPLIAAFWETVFFDADWLVNQIETIEVTLEQWHKFKAAVQKQRRDRALACLFLNRTSFSGILARAGPIGGYQQKSQYKIDCRFPRETLVKRIRQAEALKDRVAFVWNLHWKKGISLIRQMQQRGTLPKTNILFYFDPPFFEKAEQLYTYYFDEAGHRKLRDAVVKTDDPWILSYDSAERVKELYADAKSGLIELLYSTSVSSKRCASQEVVITNLEYLPGENNLSSPNKKQENIKSSVKAVSTGNRKATEILYQQLELFDYPQSSQEINKQEVTIGS